MTYAIAVAVTDQACSSQSDGSEKRSPTLALLQELFPKGRLVVRSMNRLRAKQEAAPPPEPPAEVKLLGEIRDLLKVGR